MSMKNPSSYSVLMSVYAKEKPANLRQSLSSMLTQTVAPQELVLVCDGPLGDALDAVVADACAAKPGVMRVVRLSENGGLGNALRVGLAECRCEIVARMDSDDISVPERCSKQLDAINVHGCDVVSCNLIEFAGTVDCVISEKKVPETHEEIVRYSKRRNPFNHPCVMFRKSSVEAVGGYRDFPLLEDYYLWLRMLASGCKGYNVQEPLLYMRCDEGMYGRRGGIEYMRSQMRLAEYMRSVGWITPFGQACFVAERVASSLIPTFVRKRAYRALLRKGV